MVSVTQEEKTLPYYKYFEREMAPISEEKLAIWQGPAAAPSLATPFAMRDRFLDAEPANLESGFCVAPDGSGFVANAIFMPGVTPEMFSWWFAWHCIGPDLRYKIWDRDDHYHARAHNPEHILDTNVPLAEKTWGSNHQILEDIGLGPDALTLSFVKPSDLGYSMDKIGKPGCAAMVCAAGKSSTPAVMTHKVMQGEGGVWLKSNFWMGYGQKGDGYGKLIPDWESIPEMVPRALFGHCIKEYTNLASFLPEIYAEQGPEISI